MVVISTQCHSILTLQSCVSFWFYFIWRPSYMRYKNLKTLWSIFFLPISIGIVADCRICIGVVRIIDCLLLYVSRVIKSGLRMDGVLLFEICQVRLCALNVICRLSPLVAQIMQFKSRYEVLRFFSFLGSFLLCIM